SSFHRTSVPLLRFALSNHPPRTTLFPYTALFRSVHHADPQRLVQNPLRDYADAERLAGAGARNDAERLALRSPARERLAVLAHEQRLDVEPERHLDGFARRPGRCYDDDASAGMFCAPVGFYVGRKGVVAVRAHRELYPPRDQPLSSACVLRAWAWACS